MPSPSLQSSLVRILTDDQDPRRPRGAGFLVTPNHILTCAHAINAVLRRNEQAADQPAPATEIFLDFPLLNNRPLLRAKILHWFPVQEDSAVGEREDIAVLELLPDTPLPAEARPAPLVALDNAASFTDQRLRMCGFPGMVDEGTYIDGILKGRIGTGYWEIHPLDNSRPVEQGFSGTAVWDVQENAVCGMINSRLRRKPDQKSGPVITGYMLPASALIKAFPDLDQLSRPANPYRGLEAFREKDAELYFGRDKTVDRLRQVVADQPFTAVIGASGSGKSSVVFAGLVPALRKNGDWLVTHCRPKKQPLYELAACLIPLLYDDPILRSEKTDELREKLYAGSVGLTGIIRQIREQHESQRFLLIVDQFEELFTLNADQDLIRQYIGILLECLRTEDFTVLLTMRADFFAAAVSHPALAEALDSYAPIILPQIDEQGLREVVEQPAKVLGVHFEPGLTDLIVSDVGKEPGSLPLLEFCLTQLWERQEFRRISHDAYKTIGGVQQALANHADAVYAEFDEEEQERLRHIFLKLAVLKGHEAPVNSAAFSPDGKSIVSASNDSTLRIWNTATGQQLALIKGDQSVIKSAAFSPDGKSIVSASGDKTLRIWDAKTGEQLALLKGHEDWINSAAFSPDGKSIASASHDKTVRIWDAVSGQQLALLKGHQDSVSSAAFSPDGKSIVSASRDNTLRIWNAATGQQLALLKGHYHFVSSAAFSTDGKRIVSASSDNTLRIWDAATGQQLALLKGHEESVSSAAFSPDGKSIVSASDDKTLRIWDATTGQQLALLKGHEDWANSAAFSPDGKSIVSASDDKTLRIWDATTGQQLALLKGHKSLVSSAAFSPDGKSIVSASRDNTLRIWNAATGQQLAILKGHQARVNSAAFSPDGTSIVSASQDYTVRIWNAATGQQLAVLKGHQKPVTSAAFSPDGTSIVSASWDKTVRIWDASSGQQMAILKGHEEGVNSVAFSPDGKSIVSASWDKSLRIWDAATGQQLAALQGHKDRVNSAAFSPDGKSIVSASKDKTVRIWDLTFYNQFLHKYNKPTPLYHSFIEAVKFLWQLDVQGLEIVKTKRRTPADLKKYGTLLAPPPPDQSKFDQVLEWAEKQQGK